MDGWMDCGYWVSQNYIGTVLHHEIYNFQLATAGLNSLNF